MVELGEVVEPISRGEVPDTEKEYRLIGVKWWGAGVYEYARKGGGETKAPFLFEVRTDDVVINKIWARHGSVSVVTSDLDGAHGSSEFPTFIVDRGRLDPQWVKWWSKSPVAWSACAALSYGTSGMNRIQPRQFLSLAIQLPPLLEQRRIVARLSAVARRLADRQTTLQQQLADLDALLHAAFARIAANAPKAHMGDVAPLVRRPVDVKDDETYPELGIRSFGRGAFHKPAVAGIDVGTKRLFRIEPGDLLFSNVFAWEGAVAIASTLDHGRVGSHRFMTCVADPSRVSAEILRFFFLSPEGLRLLGAASPGGAGRNRTLGLSALELIEVPIPTRDAQYWFDQLHTKITSLRAHHTAITADCDALLPAMLNDIFG